MLDDATMLAAVNAGSSAVVAFAFLRGLYIAEKVTFRLIETVERLTDCAAAEDERRE